MNHSTQQKNSGSGMLAVRSKIAIAMLATGAITVSMTAQAALPGNALLTIVKPISPAGIGIQPTDGSWFSMLAVDTNSDYVPDTNAYTKLDGFNGLKLGTTQAASGSHGGAPNGSETPNIDKAWSFFGNTGLDFTAAATNVLSASGASATINFSGWTVTWNGIASIPMNSGAWESGFSNGVAKVTCGAPTNTCADGDDYTLDYSATVPANDPSNFGGVQYHVHLAGKVVTKPVAAADSSVTTPGNAVTIDVLANDAAPSGINPATVAVGTPTAGGTLAVNPTTGVVTYTPAVGAVGAYTDTFTYTFYDKAAIPVISNSATVTVAVHVNAPPTANTDTATAIVGTSTTIDVLTNDTDPDGNINPATVAIVQTPSLSGASVTVDNTTGQITYHAGNVAGSDSFTYTVSDTGGPTPPATSNIATVNVTVQPWSGNFPTNLTAGTVPILMIESGSYFGMELTPGTVAKTPMQAGADGGVIVGLPQYAAGTHSGPPNNPSTETTGIDKAWGFFGNTGMHFTANGGIGVNSDGVNNGGTLDFTTWRVTWNGIPAINMGGSPQDNTVVRGKAAITCSGTLDGNGNCADGSAFTLNYMAHVPDGDPSGFGKVPYSLHLVGHVRFLNTTVASDGSIGQNPSHPYGTTRVTATQLLNAGVAVDTAAGTPCVGDCFDFRVTGLTLGRAKVVLPLSVGIRPGSTYRKYMNGAWQAFDTTTLTNGVADTVKSAPLVMNTANCPAAGDGSYTTGLTAGNRCVQLDIADGGPNDANGTLAAANGIIDDPSGVLAPVAAAPIDNRTTGSSGCSLSADPVSVLKRADWLLLLGFVGWLGLLAARRKRAS